MKTILKFAALVAIAAPTMSFAQGMGVTEEQLNAMRSALTDVGCTVNDDTTAQTVESVTGFDEATLGVIVAQLRVYEEIVDASEEGGITLISGDCAI